MNGQNDKKVPLAYQIIVTGVIPLDIRQRVSRIHVRAILKAQTKK